MTAPDSRDSVERVVAEMREHAADLLASAEAIDASNLADKFDAVADEFRKAAAEETDRADRLQALARGPQQAGGGAAKWTPEEVARQLAERPNQPHYIAALVRKAIALETAALQAEVARLREAGRSVGYVYSEIVEVEGTEPVRIKRVALQGEYAQSLPNGTALYAALNGGQDDA